MKRAGRRRDRQHLVGGGGRGLPLRGLQDDQGGGDRAGRSRSRSSTPRRHPRQRHPARADEHADGDRAAGESHRKSRDEVVAERDSRVPLGRKMGTGWDVAQAALFLASDDARFITGGAAGRRRVEPAGRVSGARDAARGVDSGRRAGGRDPQPLQRLLLECLVVDLAVGGPPDRVDRDHAAWAPCSAARRSFTWAMSSAVVDRRRRRRGSTTAVMASPNLSSGTPTHDGVAHRRVGLEHLLDLLGEHLLAAGVDAHRAAAEQGERAVGLDRGVVAGDRVALAVDDEERGRRLLRVLVVADRLWPRDRDPADLARARLRRRGRRR